MNERPEVPGMTDWLSLWKQLLVIPVILFGLVLCHVTSFLEDAAHISGLSRDSTSTDVSGTAMFLAPRDVVMTDLVQCLPVMDACFSLVTLSGFFLVF